MKSNEEIYKGLLALGLTTENIGKYATGFAYWYKNAAVKIPTPCRIVYHGETMQMMALPFLDIAIPKAKVWGIQIGDVCFSLSHTQHTDATQIEQVMDAYFGKMFGGCMMHRYRSVDVVTRLRLPTVSEMENFDLSRDDVAETLEILSNNGIVCDGLQDLFWAYDEAGVQIARLQDKKMVFSCKTSSEQTCAVRPVMRLSPDIDIIGSTDEYGVPQTVCLLVADILRR